MNRKFAKIRQKLGFPTDEPLETLLERVEQKAAELPDNIELAYLHAELLRKLKRHQDAQQIYQKVTQISANHAEQRHDKLSARLLKVNNALKVKFYVYLTVLILFVILAIALFIINNNEKPEEQTENKTELAFVKWLAERQALQIISTLEKEAPELFFDDQRSRVSKNPIDSMLELMDPLERQNAASDSPVSETEQNDTENKPAPFQCSVAPTMCRHQDTPEASGDYRQDIFRMVNTYAIILEEEKNCDGIAKLIEMYNDKLTWRKDEALLKARLENSASQCYYDKKDFAQSKLHAKRVICSGSDSATLTYAYLKLGTMAYELGDKTRLHNMLTCAEEYSDYFHNLYGNNDESANNYISTSAGLWSYQYDIEGYLRLSNKARDILEELLKEGAEHSGSSNFSLLSTKAVLDMNLLEAYIIGDQDLEFIHTVESLNKNPTISDSDIVIIQILDAIRLMRHKDYRKAKNVVDHIIIKLGQTAEYICSWEWDGFLKWLNEDNSPDLLEINSQIKVIVEALECDVSTQSEKLEKLRAVANWLREKA
jgi:tetratricopeptide (TPR) repeat protein